MDGYPSDWLSADIDSITCLRMTDSRVVAADTEVSPCQEIIMDWVRQNSGPNGFPLFRHVWNAGPDCLCDTGYLLEYDSNRHDFVYKRIGQGAACYIRPEMQDRCVGDLPAPTGYALKSQYTKLLARPEIILTEMEIAAGKALQSWNRLVVPLLSADAGAEDKVQGFFVHCQLMTSRTGSDLFRLVE